MSGHCDFCQVWHSGSCCHPGRHEVESLRAALAAATAREEAHTERVVRWCFNNPRRLNLTGSPTNWPNESEAQYVARALAAAKGGQDG